MADYQPNKAQKNGCQTYCRPCTKTYRNTASYKAAKKRSASAWYAKNAESQRTVALAKYYADPEPRRAKHRKANLTEAEYAKLKLAVAAHAAAVKAMVFARYGETCACCGESNMGFLTIDHINGCGKETRKEHGMGSTFYRWLKRNGFPEGFRTLCYNCNMGRSKYGGVCPHVLFSR